MPDRPLTFLFADLAGFTALTEAHGDEEAAALAGEFVKAVDAALPEGAETVKTIGDAVMVQVSDPRSAVALGLAIVSEVGGGPGFPSVRVGMHTGPAVHRDGDWFGAAVNTAARISTLARGGEVLASEDTCRAAGAVEGTELREYGRHELHNVAQPVHVYRVVATGEKASSGLPIDPVCRMAVDPARSAGRLVHDGVEYYFCSMACVQRFAAARLRASSQRRPGGDGTALAVIIRFAGDPEDLLGRFERVRESWIESQGDEYERPVFYAACRTDEGIAVVSGWQDAAAHRAFGQQLHAHMEAVGMAMPDRIERMRIEKLGWD